MKQYYWAVRPVSMRGVPEALRIERAHEPRQAALQAFGGPLRWSGRLNDCGRYEAKNLGSRVSVIQSDSKRVALLRDPSGWEPVV